MRRRSWWLICILDLQFSEELGVDLTILPGTYDTDLPSNIDDSDLMPDMAVMPVSRRGRTDCTVARVRSEFCALWQRLAAKNSTSMLSSHASLTQAEWEHMVVDLYRRTADLFFKDHREQTNPLFQMVAIVMRTVTAKMALSIYQPNYRKSRQLDETTRKKFWLTTIEIVESHHALRSSSQYQQWRWVFETHMQWNATAYILKESLERPWISASERAWELAGSIPELEENELTDNCVHVSLSSLRLEMTNHRDAEIARLRADVCAVEQLDAEEDDCYETGGLRPVIGIGEGLSRVRDRLHALARPEEPRSGNFSPTDTSGGAMLFGILLDATPLSFLSPGQMAILFDQVTASRGCLLPA